MKPIPVVWTNDDIGFGRTDQLSRQLDFLDSLEIPGVFFVIPQSSEGSIDEDESLLKVIASARERGHEFYQHGYLHSAFECGIPQLEMFDLDIRSKLRFDRDRDEVEAQHTLEALVEMLENGQRIWRRAFGEPSEGFRPGWGAYCGNFYKALHILGYQWVSSRLPSMTTYLQQYGQPIEFFEGRETKPHLLKQGVWEFPIGPEVGWRVPNSPERIHAMVELGMAHFDAVYARQEPMLIVSHYHGLGFQGELEGCSPLPSGTGYAVHEKYLPLLQASGKAQFMGMKQLSVQYIH